MENDKFKYIVYCTTNLINNYIYVGVHQVHIDNIEDSYIGCDCYATRPASYAHPKTHFQYAVKKYGPSNFKRSIIKMFDNEDDAYQLEELIVDEDFLKRPDVYNMILGGKLGISGSDCTCKKIYKYTLSGEFVCEYKSIKDASAANNRSVTSIGRALKYKTKCANYFWSEKKFEHLDTTLYKTEDEYRGFPVFQYSATGEYECCYDSITVCSKLIGACDTNLLVAIKLGTKCKGKYYTTVYGLNYSFAKNEKLKYTKVYQYSLDGKFIKEWESGRKANKTLGFTSNIYNAIRLNRTAGGFQWSLEKLSEIAPVQPKTGKARPVGKFDIAGNLVKSYPTLRAAKKENGVALEKVLYGKTKNNLHKGFIYKYLDIC